uniref:E3 ubiquitin-protein ligase PPP1R11 n=1 Tax=Caenorhabditis japonica TaxID=281687 RepID=A0A8R1HQC8_CAEJA
MSHTQQRAAATTTTTTTVTETVPDERLVLHLGTQPATSERRHVVWATETVDNEGMGKKKSKCCCIYKKPKNWQDSSSDEDSDCETGHCRGHVEQKAHIEKKE